MTEKHRFEHQKYGLFVHYVPYLSVDRAGAVYPPEDTAAAFDVERFAREVASTGAEYVIFTAWHAGMYLLYPSIVMESYCPGRSVQRDLIGEMIDALRRYDISVWLYTHPYLGYHLSQEERVRTGYGKNDAVHPELPDSETFCHERWNEFVCAVFGELAERYGSRVDGLFLDEGTPGAKMGDYVDFARLRNVILEKAPGLLLLQNFYGTRYACDLGMKEYGPGWGEFRFSPEYWPCYEMPVGVVCSEDWMAKKPSGEPVLRFQPEDMFRYTVLEASCNQDGGGVCWAAGPYVDGGWEDGILSALQRLGELYKEAGPSIRGTVPSTAYPTVSGTNLSTLPNGVAATRSADGDTEYLHVLIPPEGGKPLLLPAPEDGAVFYEAVLTDGTPVSMKQTDSGLELMPDKWDPLDTVICLRVSERRQPKQERLCTGHRPGYPI